MKLRAPATHLPAHNLRAPAPDLHPLCRHIPNDHPPPSRTVPARSGAAYGWAACKRCLQEMPSQGRAQRCCCRPNTPHAILSVPRWLLDQQMAGYAQEGPWLHLLPHARGQATPFHRLGCRKPALYSLRLPSITLCTHGGGREQAASTCWLPGSGQTLWPSYHLPLCPSCSTSELQNRQHYFN